MSSFEVLLLAIGVMVILLGAVARTVRGRSVSIPMLSLAGGVVFAAAVRAFGVALAVPPQVLYEVATISLAVGLLGSALKLPKWDVFKRWRAMLVLLGLVMTLAWLTTGVLVHWLLQIPWGPALLIGACVAPTDPILSRAILLGDLAEKNVPERLRFTILGESSVNDGTGLPFVALMLVLVSGSGSIAGWFTGTVLWAVLGSVAVGLAVGWLAARLEAWAHESGRASAGFHVSLPVSLAIVAVMAIRLLGSDGVLGVFFAGVALRAYRHPRSQDVADDIQGLIDDMFGVAVFFLLGLALPWSAWSDAGWLLAVLVATVLLVRRLPWVLAFRPLMSSQVRTNWEAAFAGWFGPMGVSALFYALFAVRITALTEVWTICTAIVVGSIFVHGVTGRVLTLTLGRVEQQRRACAMRESARL